VVRFSRVQIDFLATDHAPHTAEEKNRSFIKAPFGVVGFETLFASLYTHFVLSGKTDLNHVLEWVTVNPARIIGHSFEGWKNGMPASFAVVDLDEEWTVTREDLVSRSKNSAFLGNKFKGRIKQTYFRGNQVYVEA